MTKKQNETETETETYRKIGSYELSSLTNKNPKVFNGAVWVEKYKITVEKVSTIEEDKIQLQHLWDNTTNGHDIGAIIRYATKIGYELQGENGNKK